MQSWSTSAGERVGGHSALFVSDERGWPRTTGYRRRIGQLLRSVADVGPTTWVVAPRNRFDGGSTVELPPDLSDSVTVIETAAPEHPTWRTAIRWATTNLPWSLAAGDWNRADLALKSLAVDRFDVVWAMGIDALLAVRRAGIESRTIFVDADLESLKLRRRLQTQPPAGRLKQLVLRSDVSRWDRLEQQAAAGVTGFSVCSEVERKLLGGHAFVSVNSYSRPEPVEPGSTGSAAAGRTLLFVGSLDYEPNVDGLRWFIDDVWPRIRERDSAVRLRVVGIGGRALSWLTEAAGVDFVGRVDDIGPELAGADVSVVPLRWGAGTRIKILEAFALRLPVVSTSLGAEGLRVADGCELLVADDADTFARHCLGLLADPDLARDVVDAAYRRFAGDYEESVVRHALTARLLGAVESVTDDRSSTDR